MPGTPRPAVSSVTRSPSSTRARHFVSTARRRPKPCPRVQMKRAGLPHTGRIGDDEPPMPVADPALHASRHPAVRHPSCGRKD